MELAENLINKGKDIDTSSNKTNLSINKENLPMLYQKIIFVYTEKFCEKKLGYTHLYEGWNFNSGNYLFTTDTK